MGPGGQREESELTCGPGLSARGRECLRGDAGYCAAQGRASWAVGGCLLGWRALRARDRRVGSSGRGGRMHAAAGRKGR